MTQQTDYLIIGGGIMGLASAWRLAQLGKQVVLVEKDACGSGASLASLGALMPYSPWHDQPLAHAQHHSLWMYPEFVKELFNETGIDPQYRKLGRFQFLTSEHQLDNYTLGAKIAIDTWKHDGAGDVIEILSKEDAQKIEPEIDCGEYGVAYCRATGHVRVEYLVAALRSACMKRGVDIRENSMAHELLVEEGNVIGAATATGTIYADNTVLAAGAWSKKLLPTVTLENGEVDEQLLVNPVKGQALMLQSEKPLLKHLLRGRGIYVVPVDGNKYLIGATKENPGVFDTSIDDDGRDKLLEKAEALVPALAEAKIVKQWAGLRPQSEVRIPVVGKSETHDGLYIMTGHGGIGVCMLPGAVKQLMTVLAE